jgi:hypothetical protein
MKRMQRKMKKKMRRGHVLW